MLILSKSSLALTKQEVTNTSLEVSRLLKQVTLNANNGDVRGACSSARRAIGLFATIDPQKDIDTAFEKRSYSEAATSINEVSQAMKGVCF
jgi:hypothetical protein